MMPRYFAKGYTKLTDLPLVLFFFFFNPWALLLESELSPTVRHKEAHVIETMQVYKNYSPSASIQIFLVSICNIFHNFINGIRKFVVPLIFNILSFNLFNLSGWIG